MQAIVFAAGLGSRLGKITCDTPKALVKVNGKSMLERIVEKCSSEGFDDIIVNVHHHPQKMFAEIDRLKRLGYKLTISDETDLLLDTAGGLFNARNFFHDQPFLAINVDIITNFNLQLLYNAALSDKSAIATLFTHERPASRVFLIDNKGYVKGWLNRVTKETICPDTSVKLRELSEIPFGCIQIIKPDIFNYMQEGKLSLTPLYLDMVKKGINILTYRYDTCYWFDIGTPEMLYNADEFLQTLH